MSYLNKHYSNLYGNAPICIFFSDEYNLYIKPEKMTHVMSLKELYELYIVKNGLNFY